MKDLRPTLRAGMLAMSICLGFTAMAQTPKTTKTTKATTATDATDAAMLKHHKAVIESRTDAAMNTFVSDLLKKMTLEEKLGQLNLLTSDMDVTGPSLRAGYKEDILAGRCGNIFNAYTPQYTRQLQELAMRTRLKIPLLFGYDVIHGHKTIFPIPLGEACTWDMGLLEQSARIAAAEASADGLNWTYSPMVDIARDPRWGRVAEGVGEDTWYGVQAAKAKVKGYQGASLAASDAVLACVKHFALYGAVEAGRDYNTVDMSRRQMYQFYLPPYKAAVDAGVASVMTSFNEVDGIPATANKWLMTDLLRKEWGFKGFVVTDYTAINEMLAHGVGATTADVGALALNAGVDMDMQGSVYINDGKKLVADKRVSMAQIDQAVTRVLEAKYKLGLFANPFKNCDTVKAATVIMSQENLNAARDIAERSIVLLKNQDQLLPLKRLSTNTVAVIGPLADNQRDMIGSWSAAGDWHKAMSLYEGLKAKTDRPQLLYAKGANILEDTVLIKKLNAFGGNIVMDSKSPQQLIDEAVATAQKADVVVLALGETSGMSGEAASRSDLNLPENQHKLLEAILATGKPVVLVLMNGHPLTLTWEDAHVPAILETWFLGTEAGNAIADVLLGDYNPGGKLTMSFPRAVGQIPVYYNHKNTGRPFNPDNKYSSKYLDIANEPLYPFGYGLSYSTFRYDQLKLATTKLAPGKNLEIAVNVTNDGPYSGEEVVQLYLRDKVGSVTRPVKELKGFQKIMMLKGQTTVMHFTLTPEDLKFYDKDMKWTSEPGEFTVMIGGNSRDVLSADFTLLEK